LTLHTSEGSYLAHTQGKKHQTNLARRAAKEARENNLVVPAVGPAKPLIVPRRNMIKIGRPGYRVTKVRDPVTRQLGFLFQIQYPQIAEDVIPRHRFMGAYEQKIESPNNAYQYLVIAAEPYESISFKIQSTKVDETPGKFWTHWDQDLKQFSLQFFFKSERNGMFEGMSEPSMAPPVANKKKNIIINNV
jgi:splicing factor 3A subunit 2